MYVSLSEGMELCDTQEAFEYSGIIRTVGDKRVHCQLHKRLVFLGLAK